MANNETSSKVYRYIIHHLFVWCCVGFSGVLLVTLGVIWIYLSLPKFVVIGHFLVGIGAIITSLLMMRSTAKRVLDIKQNPLPNPKYSFIRKMKKVQDETNLRKSEISNYEERNAVDRSKTTSVVIENVQQNETSTNSKTNDDLRDVPFSFFKFPKDIIAEIKSVQATSVLANDASTSTSSLSSPHVIASPREQNECKTVKSSQRADTSEPSSQHEIRSECDGHSQISQNNTELEQDEELYNDVETTIE